MNGGMKSKVSELDLSGRLHLLYLILRVLYSSLTALRSIPKLLASP